MSKKKASNLPRILYLGAEALTGSHGTGQMFKRHFSHYPRENILDVYFQAFSADLLFPSHFVPAYDLRYSPWKTPGLEKFNSALIGKGTLSGKGSLLYQHILFEPPAFDWSCAPLPDLIYSTSFSFRDLAFLHHIHRSLPKRIPIVQHFLDLNLENYVNFVKIYQELFPYMAEVWALNENMVKAVSKFSARKPKIVQALQQKLPDSSKKTHRPFSPGFKSLLIGNVWSVSAYHALESIWRDAQKKIPLLPAIKWAGPPRRAALLANEKKTLDPKGKIIRDIGYLSDQELVQELENADITVVAFSGAIVDRPYYHRFSLPSRIGDYCAHGLPLVVISGKDTPPYQLVKKYKLGIALDPAEQKQSVKALCDFIKSPEERARCGKNARRFAERELNLETYQQALYPKLSELADFKVPGARHAESIAEANLSEFHKNLLREISFSR
jgi:glycosyltransferase involved in cell wall biosynthesis